MKVLWGSEVGASSWVRVVGTLGLAGLVSALVLAIGLPTGHSPSPVVDQEPRATAQPDAPSPIAATPTPAPTATPSDSAAGATAVTYAFPVQPATAASYGRDHHDYPATDIFAPCGTPLVAPVEGVVDEVSVVDRWDPQVNDPATRGGLSIAIVGIDEVRHYMSHLDSIDQELQVGRPVTVGSQIGTVGRSGNAASTPCHVHYGLSPPRGPGDALIRRGVVWPWPYLDAWRTGDTSRSPKEEVQAWAAPNPQQ